MIRPRSLAMGVGMGVRTSPGPFSLAAVASNLRKKQSRQEAIGGLKKVTNYERNLNVQACETSSKSFPLSGLYFLHL